jgi:hypothetical protein
VTTVSAMISKGTGYSSTAFATGKISTVIETSVALNHTFQYKTAHLGAVILGLRPWP